MLRVKFMMGQLVVNQLRLIDIFRALIPLLCNSQHLPMSSAESIFIQLIIDLRFGYSDCFLGLLLLVLYMRSCLPPCSLHLLSSLQLAQMLLCTLSSHHQFAVSCFVFPDVSPKISSPSCLISSATFSHLSVPSLILSCILLVSSV